MNEEYVQLLYARAVEVQPQLGLLVQDFKAMGITDEQIAIELAFAMLHEGYRMRYLEEYCKTTKLVSQPRKLQTVIALPKETKI